MGRGKLRPFGRRIQTHQDLASLHPVTRLEADRLDGAKHLRGHRDALFGHHGAHRLKRGVPAQLLNLGGGDRLGGRGEGRTCLCHGGKLEKLDGGKGRSHPDDDAEGDHDVNNSLFHTNLPVPGAPQPDKFSWTPPRRFCRRLFCHTIGAPPRRRPRRAVHADSTETSA